MRLDLAASRTFGLSRRAAREAVRAGRIDVAGATRDEPGLDVPEDAKLSFQPDRPTRRRVVTRLTVLAEEADFLIVDKPAGLLSVPTAEREGDTLLSRTLDYLHHRYRRRPYAGVVHRLDRETSGALAFARSRPALESLQKQFRAHTIAREYLAIVEGKPPASGTLDADLVRDGGDRRRSVARRGERGRRAVTHFRVVEQLAAAALVSVELETGRTHQIRVHFAAAGHPVLGDRVYRRSSPHPAPLEVPRQMLHARRLGFSHPSTGAFVEALSPIPEDFSGALAALRRLSKDKKNAPRSSRR